MTATGVELFLSRSVARGPRPAAVVSAPGRARARVLPDDRTDDVPNPTPEEGAVAINRGPQAPEPPVFTHISVVARGGEVVIYALDKLGEVWRGNDRGEWQAVPMDRKAK